jgi:small conductance mechanosensitive channel
MDFDELWSTVIDKLKGWTTATVEWLPNLGLALVVGLLLFFLSKAVRKGAQKAIARSSIREAAQTLFVRVVYFGCLVGTLMVVLSILELSKTVTSLLAGVGVVGLALGFAFQDLAANFISGVGLSVKKLFEVGDIIETNDELGVVEEIELRTTAIRTFDGKRVIVPNKKIFQEVLVNHSDNELRRLDLGCGVTYDSDLERVQRIAEEALSAIERRAGERDPEVFFTEFGDSSIDFTARVWFDYQRQKDLTALRSEMIVALKRAFDANDITIPFPIRTLDFGDCGGSRLDEVWPEAAE